MPVSTINDGNGLNSAGGSVLRNKSKFINKYPIGGTYRFGEYGINFCAETVPDDNHTIHLGHNIISNTLKAPLLQDIILKKDLFWVPDMAILPLNWEKFFVNPVKGEDVPNDVGTSVEHFKYVLDYFTAWKAYLLSFDPEDPDASTGPFGGDTDKFAASLIRYMLCMEMIFSDGCLNSALQGNLAGCFSTETAFGKHFDYLIELLRTAETTIIIDSNRYTIDSDTSAKDVRTILSMIRDDLDFTVEIIDEDEVFVSDSALALTNIPDFQTDPITSATKDFVHDLKRLYAYQLVCAHFFTNDKIDYVYSAELYRQLVYNAYLDWKTAASDTTSDNFQVNGLTYQYDYLSAHTFNTILASGYYEVCELQVAQYLRLIFGYNNSLRYSDYFTGSRSQPLAVGDVTVAVNANKVNVVDVAAKTMAAKMLNVANRIGQRIESYVSEFFGIEMAKDYHNPFWLAHTADQIDNPENQNTGAAQYSEPNSITSLFRTGGNSAGFETTCDRSGVIIGITYFDIQRVYPRPVHRNFFHLNRYDDFLPYLQYVGDQTVSQMELDSHQMDVTFGYQGRNMEYKQQVPYCFGGFRDDLSPYVFLADEARRIVFDARGTMNLRIGPSYIRSLPSELDRFYNKLNGYSLDTYYHFTIVNNIYWEAVRPMAATPGILNG